MQKLFSIFLTFIIAGFFTSCEYEVIEPVEVETPDNVSFANDVVPVFEQCLTCHSGANAPNLADGNVYATLTTGTNDDGEPYINTENPAQSPFYTFLSEDNHYPGISSADLATLLGWIEQGAQDN